MDVGLVGYFGFGNYGDDLFVQVHRSALPDAKLTILKGCDGIRRHDPVEVAQQDCIIIGGGDLVITSGFSERYWSPTLLQRPVFIVGVGVDNERGYSASAVRRMREFFQHQSVKLITARDEASMRWIRRHLQPRIAVEFYPDLVASLPMARLGSSTPTLGLVLRSGVPQDFDNLQRFLDHVVELGFRTVGIVLGTGLTCAQDLDIAGAIQTEDVVVCDSTDALTRALARCDIVASQRLHGCMAAMMMGIPAIGLRTTRKFHAWFEQFEPPPRLLSVDDPRLVGSLEWKLPPIDRERIASIRVGARSGVDRLAGVVSTVPRRRWEPPYHYYAPFDGPAERRARWSQLSPRLRSDPMAQLDLEQELTWYRSEIARWKGTEYLQSIDKHVENTAELAKLPPGSRAIVAIPVAAAAESETIYNTLSLYAQQGASWLACTTFLLFVNYPDSRMSEPGDGVRATIREIMRARDDFPQLRLAVIIEPFDAALPRRHQGIIGYVARRMYDLALMTVLRAIHDGLLAEGQDIILIRNDADAVGLSSRYLERMIDAAARHPSTDAFVGGIHWGTANYVGYPGFGVAMGFKEGIRAMTMRHDRYDRLPATNGTNVTVRMSTLAAVGGVGHSAYYGAGGDDVEIGTRINEARRRDGGGKRSIRYVTGSAIDATGERALSVYRTGKSVIHTWDTFNDGEGGYTKRCDAGDHVSDTPEGEDSATSIRRIEQAITDLVTHWYNERELAEAALRLMIGNRDGAGEPVYRTRWRNGRFELEFTKSGSEWITRRLEGYGERLRDRLYAVSNGHGPRMVAPLS